MRRRKLLPRKASLKPKLRKPVKRVNPARKAKDFARCFGSKERVEWVQRQRCVVCGQWPSENAHTENGGMGRKGDYTTIIPLCKTCHRFQHQNGWKLLLATADEGRIERWLKEQAAAIDAAWQHFSTGGR